MCLKVKFGLFSIIYDKIENIPSAGASDQDVVPSLSNLVNLSLTPSQSASMYKLTAAAASSGLNFALALVRVGLLSSL